MVFVTFFFIREVHYLILYKTESCCMRHENIQLSAVFLCPSRMSSQNSDSLGLTTGLQARPQEGGAETEEGRDLQSHVNQDFSTRLKQGFIFILLLGVSILAGMRSAT